MSGVEEISGSYFHNCFRRQFSNQSFSGLLRSRYFRPNVKTIFVNEQDLDPSFSKGPWKNEDDALREIQLFARNPNLGGGIRGIRFQAGREGVKGHSRRIGCCDGSGVVERISGGGQISRRFDKKSVWDAGFSLGLDTETRREQSLATFLGSKSPQSRATNSHGRGAGRPETTAGGTWNSSLLEK